MIVNLIIVPVVSKKDGVASHLTFNVAEWNDLSMDDSVPFEWWLGEGGGRLCDAMLINPEHKPQPVDGLPVFFAQKRKKGGALCYYGGHWSTTSFQRLSGQTRLRFKGEGRQARIELTFHHFERRMAEAVNAIPPPGDE